MVLVFPLILGTHLQFSIWNADVGRLPQVEGQPGLHREMHAHVHSLKNNNKKSVSKQVLLGEVLRKSLTDGIARFLKTASRHPVKLKFKVKRTLM